ncbi:MAG: response regulator [marine benthic group bacterium]|nr:response regulator [Gemmatimonadota bacterium]
MNIPEFPEFGRARKSTAGSLRDLMRFRVQNILFVSSLYESFIMAEDGQLNELILTKFLDLNLNQAPNITRVSSGSEALSLARDKRFDVIITSLQLGDMNAAQLARAVREADLDLPVLVLAYDHAEVKDFEQRYGFGELERVFLWQGDARILLAMVKLEEDSRNVEFDASLGVPVLLVVEDSVRYYSSFLPVIYSEVMKLTQSIVSEGVNLYQRLLRMRARPKILLANNFEEAWEYFSAYRNNVMGVISDVDFPLGEEKEASPSAGLELAKRIRDARPDVPILLQSSNPEFAATAADVSTGFLLKRSPTMLDQIRRYLTEQSYFGDFVFRLPSGEEVDRAGDLRTLLERLESVPAESIGFHAARNDFSSWLRARGEFALAYRLRPRTLSDYASVEALRDDLIDSIGAYRRRQSRSTVADYDPEALARSGGIMRIGGGSIGGKGRGLAFATRLIDRFGLEDRFPGVRIFVPPAVILGTEVFDEFLDVSELRSLSLHSRDEREVERRFTEARFPPEARLQLTSFVMACDRPLAIRSSSLLEDSPYQPFAGIFDTIMIPNDHPDPAVRVEQLIAAIKSVYASTFSAESKAFLEATPYRLEEESMAVIIQELIGQDRDGLFFPDVSGVARSYNYYPTAPMASNDGIAAVALGLGKTVVEGAPCFRFCPSFPQHNVEFSTVEDMVNNSQRSFWALRLADREEPPEGSRSGELEQVPLRVAKEHGVLNWVGSTYSAENKAVYDGLSRPGVPIVSMAPILKHDMFPLAEILRELLRVGSIGTSSPVEIEFAVNLETPADRPAEFAFLQLRPFSSSREKDTVEMGELAPGELICESTSALGHGHLDEIHDIVVVDRERFDRSRSRACVAAVSKFNRRLVAESRPYLLIGVGRWGSTEPWLGIPVRWSDISGARVIVEAGFKDMRVTPSQGTHFFQNLTSLNIGYLTVNEDRGEGFVDWSFLAGQPAVEEIDPVRHLRFDSPVMVTMNGSTQHAIIRKPAKG